MAQVEEMVRLSVRVTPETRDELVKLAGISGLKMPAFLQAAVIIGGRQLARLTNPEHFVDADMLRSMMTAVGIDVGRLQAEMGQGFDQLLLELKGSLREEEPAGEVQQSA
jgi:hypothetical protein